MRDLMVTSMKESSRGKKPMDEETSLFLMEESTWESGKKGKWKVKGRSLLLMEEQGWVSSRKINPGTQPNSIRKEKSLESM